MKEIVEKIEKAWIEKGWVIFEGNEKEQSIGLIEYEIRALTILLEQLRIKPVLKYDDDYELIDTLMKIIEEQRGLGANI
jgi:hypothetical protein